jgi:hypothetical protein
MRNLLLLIVLNFFLSVSVMPQILTGETSGDKEPGKMFMNSHNN